MKIRGLKQEFKTTVRLRNRIFNNRSEPWLFRKSMYNRNRGSLDTAEKINSKQAKRYNEIVLTVKDRVDTASLYDYECILCFVHITIMISSHGD